MRADRRRDAAADPVENHSAARDSRPDLSRHFRLHAILERIHLRADLHLVVGEQDGSSRRHHRTGRGRRLPLGFADGGGAVRLAAGGDPVLVFRRVLRVEPDRCGQGIAVAGWDGRPRKVFHPSRSANRPREANRAYIVIASLVHFLTKEVIAAPCRLLSLACPSQDVLSHFVMKLVLAAPASFLSVACVMQASSAYASAGAPARPSASATSASVLVIDNSPESGRPFAAMNSSITAQARGGEGLAQPPKRKFSLYSYRS